MGRGVASPPKGTRVESYGVESGARLSESRATVSRRAAHSDRHDASSRAAAVSFATTSGFRLK